KMLEEHVVVVSLSTVVGGVVGDARGRFEGGVGQGAQVDRRALRRRLSAGDRSGPLLGRGKRLSRKRAQKVPNFRRERRQRLFLLLVVRLIRDVLDAVERVGLLLLDLRFMEAGDEP